MSLIDKYMEGKNSDNSKSTEEVSWNGAKFRLCADDNYGVSIHIVIGTTFQNLLSITKEGITRYNTYFDPDEVPYKVDKNQLPNQVINIDR